MPRMFSNRVFRGPVTSGSGTFPDPSEVLLGVVYGPSDNLVGTAVPFATPLADLDEANMSAFETSALSGIETIYDVQGVPADYTTDGDTERIQILIESKTTTIDNSNNKRTEVEVLRCLALMSIMPNPKVGDLIRLVGSNGTRAYKLTQQPVMADSHLEWDLEFQRTFLRKVGGVKTVPTS